MGKVHVLGSINMDLVARVARFPRPGETLMGSDFQLLPGGKGLNQAVAARRSGAGVSMHGAVGEDPNGAALREFLDREAIAVEGVRSISGTATGTAMILVDQDGENCIVVVPGANEHVTHRRSDKGPGKGDVLVAPFEVPDAAIEPAFTEAQSRGAFTVLNPAPARVCRPEILDRVDLLVVNETELSFYAGETTELALPEDRVVELVGQLARRHGADIVATLGGKGLVASLSGHISTHPARKVEVCDTTAAGDTFVGAMAARIADGEPVKTSLSFAIDAAAICVSRSGAAPSIPTLAEVRAISAAK
ncbi:MAG: ribokinase [Candidatus Binatia bacterium]|nr:ribokinase [Candidatus Binatia bacterium]MDG1957343.1 ribokinase [Candidatus Binatia bacterium]MDG2011417.1 ribokinase [Candidatus Binatia bacterium]